jgi:hypothetical protein
MTTGIPFLLVGVYRCLGVFTLVLNTVGWMEGGILIPKRIVFWRVLRCLVDFGGEG